MADNKYFEIIIVGGSYSGLAAGMALGRALRDVLIVDSGKPCNRQTPYSYNFITQDGKTPNEISAIAKLQVEKYSTVTFFNDVVTKGSKTEDGFTIETESGEIFYTKKIIFATGIKDRMPDIPGFAECWGKSVIHCPYCHGYEVRNQATGILGSGIYGYEFSSLISNWTNDLKLFTNGPSFLTAEHKKKLQSHDINIIEDEIEKLDHNDGQLQHIIFKNGKSDNIKALYSRISFVQHCSIPEMLGCELNKDGYITVDQSQKTTVPGIFVCGDNSSRIRTIANAVGSGTTAGMMVNKELIEENF